MPVYFYFLYISYLYYVILLILSSHIEFKIVQVQTFFRHGARTPIHHVKSPLTEVVDFPLILTCFKAQWTPETTKDLPETLIPVKHIDIIDGSPVEKTFDQFYQNKILPVGCSIFCYDINSIVRYISAKTIQFSISYLF